MDEIAVLVLNYTFEPLHFTNARRAITLLLAGKAEAVEASPRVVRSPSVAFALPAVIRLAIYIRKPFLDRVAFNKKNILRRDGYTCQYCNRRGERLTVDHVLPRSRGGDTTWTNVVAACLRCNLKKGNRLPEETGMRLISETIHPKFVSSPLTPRDVHPAAQHLHRERRAHQRRDRSHAPFRNPIAARASRRGGGGLRLLYLRHRRARDVPRDAPVAPGRGVARPRRDRAPAGGGAVRAQRLRLPPRDLPRARRCGGDLPRQRGVARAARRAVGRRGGGDSSDRP